MQVQMDSQLLQLSQLEHQQRALLYQFQELEAIKQYRLEGKVPELEPTPKSELDQLLGL